MSKEIDAGLYRTVVLATHTGASPEWHAVEAKVRRGLSEGMDSISITALVVRAIREVVAEQHQLKLPL